MLLLCVAIFLILGILFYEYIPTNRVIPAKEEYSTPENVKAEIEEQVTQLNKTVVSYEITDANLEVYKQNASYKPGKVNPFELISSTDGNVQNGDNAGENNEANGNINENTNVSNNSTTLPENDTGTNE